MRRILALPAVLCAANGFSSRELTTCTITVPANCACPVGMSLDAQCTTASCKACPT